jgi:hypothetical protein
MGLVTHAIPLSNGVRAIAVKDGIEVRRDVSGLTEEIICTITWRQIEHLRAVAHVQR